MSLLTRMRFATASLVALGSVAIVYDAVVPPLVKRLNNQNGPFTGIGSDIDTLVPIVIVLLMLAIIIWVIVSGVQRERAVRRRPPR